MYNLLLSMPNLFLAHLAVEVRRKMKKKKLSQSLGQESLPRVVSKLPFSCTVSIQASH